MAPPINPGNKHFLVVVADESRAIAYQRGSKSGPLEQLRTFNNEAARLKTADLIADRGGRAFDSFGQGRHTMTSEKSGPQQHLAEAFARNIADYIAADLHRGTCRGYALVAAPRFLGTLRHELAGRVSDEPYAEVDKNVVGQAEGVIEKLLARV